jgi:transposase
VFRTRDLLVRLRTQMINALRGHLAEYGLVVRKGAESAPKLVELLGIQPPPRSRQVDVVRLGNAAIPRQCTLASYPLPGNARVIG